MIDWLLRRWPLAVAIASAILLRWFEAEIVPLVHAGTISLDGLYSSVFGWSAIQTGFLFGVFGFIVGKRDGFVGAVRRTLAMRRFASDLWWAILIGFLLTFTSMPMIVYPLSPGPDGELYNLICIWFALFVWAFLLFCKVAYQFGILVQTPDKEDRLAH